MRLLPRRTHRPRRMAAAAGLLLPLLLAGCGLPLERDGIGARPRPGMRLRVVTTVLPLTAFTHTLAGDCADVRSLVPPGRDPHAVQPTPTDLTRLRQADLLILNGLGLEPYAAPLLRAAANPRLQVVVTAHDLTPTPPSDPHIWLDPRLAARQVEKIAAALSRAEPSCRPGIERRAAALVGQLRQLDRMAARRLAPHAGREFITFHEIAGPFAARYRLHAAAAVHHPADTPTTADLERVAAIVRRTRLRALFDEPQAGQQAFGDLARQLGVRVLEFDPIETGPLNADRRPGYVLERMRRNVDHLLIAFRP